MNLDFILELQKSFDHFPIYSGFGAKNLKEALKTTHFIGTHTQFKIFIKFLFLSAVFISDNTSFSLLSRCSLSGINHKLCMYHNTPPPPTYTPWFSLIETHKVWIVWLYAHSVPSNVFLMYFHLLFFFCSIHEWFRSGEYKQGIMLDKLASTYWQGKQSVEI